jgi:hypothetical protein
MVERGFPQHLIKAIQNFFKHTHNNNNNNNNNNNYNNNNNNNNNKGEDIITLL